MAVITKIEEQKNKNRVNIFVDGSFFCGRNKETAIVFGLKTGKEIEESELKAAVTESEVKSAFEKAADYISSRMHTKFELVSKLTKKGYEKSVAEKAVLKLEEYNYVNDALFAKAYINENQKYSSKMIENKLRQKGIAKDIIAEALSKRADESEFEACKKYAVSYAKGKDLTDKAAQQKLFASLARRGFGFEIIKKVCKEIMSDSDDVEFSGDFD